MEQIDKEAIKEKIIQRIDISTSVNEQEIEAAILDVLRSEQCVRHIPIREYMSYAHELFNSFTKLDMLQDLIDDPEITEIMLNGPQDIFIEKDGHIFKSGITISSKEKLGDIIQQMVGSVNKSVNTFSPITDARLKDGSRINIVLDPVAHNGPVVTIRKFPQTRIRMDDLIKMGSISSEAAKFLTTLVKAKYNIFISGGTSSGKSTFLNVLSDFIPEDERIIVIEDNLELQITNIPNIVRLEARRANTEGEGEITIRDLIKTSLRMRPDRIIVGEVRGDETVDMLQAMNTGHDGSLSTGHANSPEDMLYRLETMTLMSNDVPESAVLRQISSGVDIIVHLARLRDKSRKVVAIDEVDGLYGNEIRLNRLFTFEEEASNKDDLVKGRLVRKGELNNKAKLENAGFDILY